MLVDWIQAERERRGWAQAELARRAGLTSQAINQLESGKHKKPSDNALKRIAQAYGMTVPALYLAAYGDTSEALEQLRTAGVPPDVLARLEQAAPKLSTAQWEILVAVALDMAGREPERRRQRTPRPIAPAKPEQIPDEQPGQGNDRASA